MFRYLCCVSCREADNSARAAVGTERLLKDAQRQPDLAAGNGRGAAIGHRGLRVAGRVSIFLTQKSQKRQFYLTMVAGGERRRHTLLMAATGKMCKNPVN
ncbi:hypothetical protein [Vogesella sp. AC12]|uniref:hypothetical protein n=1 Tax=Vogesella sp. AC12 TaxID=2950550 RepID=UPI00210A6150|nr:hypothetical protein [Vogesella sp. AC12]MCQ4145027.1 hypothetical protein [Vogesella sp. AC12]